MFKEFEGTRDILIVKHHYPQALLCQSTLVDKASEINSRYGKGTNRHLENENTCNKTAPPEAISNPCHACRNGTVTKLLKQEDNEIAISSRLNLCVRRN